MVRSSHPELPYLFVLQVVSPCFPLTMIIIPGGSLSNSCAEGRGCLRGNATIVIPAACRTDTEFPLAAPRKMIENVRASCQTACQKGNCRCQLQRNPRATGSPRSNRF